MYLAKRPRPPSVIPALAAVPLAAAAMAVPATAAPAPDHDSQPAAVHAAPLDPGDRPALSPDGDANDTSQNWFGYAASGGSYNSVEASWIEPTVDCSQGGHVVFWVGLDGWGSSTVEQTGSGADCDGGSASYYGWWETYPANAIQPYDDPVRGGDQFYAKVTFNGNNAYTLYLEDQTQGWSQTKNVSGPQGASNASAEVVGETPGYSNGYADLPNFGNATFTGSAVDGSPIANSSPSAIDLVRNGDTLATTGALNGAGDTFDVNWKANS